MRLALSGRSSRQRLIAHLDESWDKRRSLKAQLAKSVPPLQERARETIQIAVKILKEKDFTEIKAAA